MGRGEVSSEWLVLSEGCVAGAAVEALARGGDLVGRPPFPPPFPPCPPSLAPQRTNARPIAPVLGGASLHLAVERCCRREEGSPSHQVEGAVNATPWHNARLPAPPRLFGSSPPLPPGGSNLSFPPSSLRPLLPPWLQ